MGAKEERKDAKPPRPCGRSDCGASSGIAVDEITFGYGKLDQNGYWEHGCWPCARAWEQKHPGEIAWPFNDETLAKLEADFKLHGREARERQGCPWILTGSSTL